MPRVGFWPGLADGRGTAPYRRLVETIARDWRKAAWFYARFGTTDGQGSFTVNGSSPPVININFSAISSYLVTFAETGLPAGTNWTVTLFQFGDGWGGGREHHVQSETSNNSTLSFLLANGTYPYRVSQVPGFASNGSWGEVSVAGASLPPINVTFTPLVNYGVAFNESGLPAGTNWSVWILGFATGGGGYMATNATSSTTNLTFNLPNGTYFYRLGWVPGWAATGGNWSGTFTVNGTSPPEITIVFTPFNWTSWTPAPNRAAPTSLGAGMSSLSSAPARAPVREWAVELA
ncbi:MAG TPA: hypothetical protein VK424_03990 [Thermoplasmata archaeon]|nr:hypothetical protein [Thermoplasmata archaeon]